ncbi:MAG TPA: polyisoprenoid-binding protein [Hellea balneolensis]|uniref:Polyisoprenoid-binding protein n=1 Tax=Hellea balneolensis TaxID=287478 RepID=A0A7C5R098_9PROT|nr:polyisoprenoid-binding protein [Hellea balneolensis]
MKLAHFTFIAVALLLGACYTPPSKVTREAPHGNYTLDPAHASVVWSLSHAGLSHYTARFDNITGALVFDSEHPQNSHVDIRIDPTSISTGDPEFDKDIAYKKSYFNANTFPEIRFVSTNIRLTGEDKGEIIGDLSFRGQTHPVTLTTIFDGAGKSFGHPGKTLGFSAITQFKRSDFGFNHLINFGIGDEVSVVIEVEFNEQK